MVSHSSQLWVMWCKPNLSWQLVSSSQLHSCSLLSPTWHWGWHLTRSMYRDTNHNEHTSGEAECNGNIHLGKFTFFLICCCNGHKSWCRLLACILDNDPWQLVCGNLYALDHLSPPCIRQWPEIQFNHLSDATTGHQQSTCSTADGNGDNVCLQHTKEQHQYTIILSK